MLNAADTAGMKLAITGGGTGNAATIFASMTVNSTGLAAGSAIAINQIDTLSTAFMVYSGGEGVLEGSGFFTTRSTGTPTLGFQIAKVTSNTATVRKGSRVSYRLATVA